MRGLPIMHMSESTIGLRITMNDLIEFPLNTVFVLDRERNEFLPLQSRPITLKNPTAG